MIETSRSKHAARAVVMAMAILAFVVPAFAASPIAIVNYEGVLRDASGAPLSGPQDMVFVFWSDPVAGDEILLDHHTVGLGGAVVASNGVFNVQIGNGAGFDGSGPGDYTSLASMFQDYPSVYLELRIGGETLSPRLRVVSAPYSLNAGAIDGKDSTELLDTTSSEQWKSGPLGASAGANGSQIGISGTGNSAGGFFQDADDGSSAYIASGQNGIFGIGPQGVQGFGTVLAGYFANNVSGATASLGTSAAIGVEAQGPTAGAYFSDFLDGGAVYLGIGGQGLRASGPDAGGDFTDVNESGRATLAMGDEGISASGTATGGVFFDSNSTGVGRVGSGDIGITAIGNGGGGFFIDTLTGTFANVASGTSKITGTGGVSFVQNHPHERDKVIVYTALEGDEAATYTRGTARLVSGEARVRLGETFAWVTNPDLGLTAYVTPIGRPASLYVASKSTTELVVRSADAASADALFDYVVYGLRIGFEQISIVQEKVHEAFIPSMAAHRARFAARPALRAFNPLERFRTMMTEAGEPVATLARASTLTTAIHEYDPRADGRTLEAIGAVPVRRELAMTEVSRPAANDPTSPSVQAGGRRIVGAQAALPGSSDTRAGESTSAAAPGLDAVASEAPHVAVTDGRAPMVWTAAAEAVDAGDVLVVEPGRERVLHRGSIEADPAVVGIAAGPTVDGKVAIAAAGIARCKVDARYGAIAVGDLLTTSPTPGHAMRSDGAKAGAILAKALGALDEGTGTIDVLVMMR